jgi:hypothetical protein
MMKPKIAALAAATLILSACGTASAGSDPGRNGLDDQPTATPTSSSALSSMSAPTSISTPEDTPTASAPVQQPSTMDVRRIALDRVGGGQVTGVEQELEHGRTEWKVRVLHDNQSYDVRVDASTGTITRFETNDDNGGDNHGDNHGGRHGGGDDRGGDNHGGRH